MAKSQVAVVVDSTATLPQETIDQYQLHVIPQSVNWEGISYHDGIDITPDEFYERLKVSKELPTTSQPSAGEFHDLFSNLAETHESIVAVLISEHLSGTVASAHAAREMMEGYPIEIVDTHSASMGLGFCAIAAAQALEQGLSHVEAAQVAQDTASKMGVLFVVDTLEYLHRGGRIGGARRLVGSVLSIKPVLQLVDGRIEALASVRTKRKALQHALDVIAERTAGKEQVHIAVMHASNPQEAQQFHDELNARLKPGDLSVAELSPAIGVHVGPGLVGAAFYTDD